MKKKYFEGYTYVFWVFMLGSFLGFVHENLLMMYRGRDVLRQGLIYEPLIPVYGAGLLLFCLVFRKCDFAKVKPFWKRFLIVFGVSFLLGGVAEYLFSFFQELIFGTISWDYSGYTFNLFGRTSLYHSTIWGLMGLVFFIFLFPWLTKMEKYIGKKLVKWLTIIFSVVLFLDCFVSTIACMRQKDRRENIPAQNVIDDFLDQHYPDELLDYIYNNARVPKKK